jgi:hypothetical protein
LIFETFSAIPNYGIIEFDGKGLIERKEAHKSAITFSYKIIFKPSIKDEYLKIGVGRLK